MPDLLAVPQWELGVSALLKAFGHEFKELNEAEENVHIVIVKYTVLKNTAQWQQCTVHAG